MNEHMESVLRRIQKLLAMAEDGRGNANEAAAAAGMAEKLMRKFQLDNADVIAAELKTKKGAGLSSAHVFANMKRDDPNRTPSAKNPPWAQHLACAIARLNDCEVRQSFANNKFGVYNACLTFFGYEADVSVSAFTFDFLVGEIIKATEQFNKAQRKAGLADKSSSEAFRRGFKAAVNASINKATEAKKQEEASSSRALVVVKRSAITAEFGDFKYGTASQSQIKDQNAFTHGLQQGRKVDINRRGVGSNGNATQQLN